MTYLLSKTNYTMDTDDCQLNDIILLIDVYCENIKELETIPISIKIKPNKGKKCVFERNINASIKLKTK